ncbi:MAG: hypothetical protein Q7Q71_05035 [Verrucomicrobiota bacterium JB023]|nr:hypothetical protein [Verrucomicrobiota bacterium JB023]
MISTISELSDFLRTYHRVWTDSPGLDPEEVPSELPVPLHEFYCRLGGLTQIQESPENGHRIPLGTQDYIAPPDRIRRVDGLVEFLWENQDCFWVRTSATGDDPEVITNWLSELGDSENDQDAVCDSLIHFLITFGLQEAVLSSAYLLQPVKATVGELMGDAIPIWLNGLYVCGEPTHDFHYFPKSEVIAMNLSGDLWLGSNFSDPRELLPPGVGAHCIHQPAEQNAAPNP